MTFHSSFGDRADCLRRCLDKIVSRETDQSIMIDWPLIQLHSSILNSLKLVRELVFRLRRSKFRPFISGKLSDISE